MKAFDLLLKVSSLIVSIIQLSEEICKALMRILRHNSVAEQVNRITSSLYQDRLLYS